MIVIAKRDLVFETDKENLVIFALKGDTFKAEKTYDPNTDLETYRVRSKDRKRYILLYPEHFEKYFRIFSP